MCSNYVPSPSEILKGTHRGERREFKAETYPGYDAPFFRAGQDGLEHVLGRFGLVPYWTKPADEKAASRRTYNARSETVATKPSFRGPWERWTILRNPRRGLLRATLRERQDRALAHRACR